MPRRVYASSAESWPVRHDATTLRRMPFSMAECPHGFTPCSSRNLAHSLTHRPEE
ncbi:hypothetical protein GBAR_LOCUS20853 [Geodia barretti]|uniref:Uncharacterized protein n=1 Tax=Geodia barretti TaxID=519541 RepID=A0AA35SXX1_GEOBA|nr:hypothetical protein GBAR_LOCUS20853 [Geodia barretti]